MKLSKKNIDSIKNVCFDAGDLLIKFQKSVRTLSQVNKSVEGIATEADEKAERYIFKRLITLFPETNFLGEETFFQEHGLKTAEKLQQYAQKEYCWILDPLDGTNNFIKNSDYFCISLALVHRSKTIFGMIYAPRKKHLFYAIKDGGCFFEDHNQKKVKKNKVIEKRKLNLNESLVTSGYGGSKALEVSVLKRVANESMGIRKFGSAALDLAYLSLGHFDAFIAGSLSPWDLAAGEIILKESKHHVVDFKGRSFHPFKSNILACKRGLKTQLLRIIGHI